MRRSSSSIENDPKLTLKLEAKVQKIIIENGRAVGVVYKQGAGVFEARTDGEMILSASACITPKLLLLSGLGPADYLMSYGIDVIEDLAGAGQNLNDHPDVSIVARQWTLRLLQAGQRLEHDQEPPAVQAVRYRADKHHRPFGTAIAVWRATNPLRRQT